MSYDNHQLIRKLYVGEQAKYVKTYQSLKGSRFVKEIGSLGGDISHFVSPRVTSRLNARFANGRP